MSLEGINGQKPRVEVHLYQGLAEKSIPYIHCTTCAIYRHQSVHSTDYRRGILINLRYL